MFQSIKNLNSLDRIEESMSMNIRSDLNSNECQNIHQEFYENGNSVNHKEDI